jgi:YVTN family beta-propeller protein
VNLLKALSATTVASLFGAIAVIGVSSGVAAAQPSKSHYQVSSTWTNVGPTPHFSAVDNLLHKVFVSNLAAGTVTVLNEASGKVISTIQLGGTVHTVMVDQQTQRVYVTDIARGRLDVINARTNSLITEIQVGAHLHGLAISQRLHEAIVTDIYQSKVYAVNLLTNTVIDPQGLTVGANPWGVAINPITKMAYVANTGIDPYAGTSSNPQGINPAGNSVSVVNLKTMSVANTISVGPHPWNVAVDTRTGSVYVGVSASNQVAVINGSSVSQYIPVESSPHGVVLDHRNHMLFVNNSLSNTVSLISTVTNAVTQTIPVGKQPQGISVNPHTGAAYVVNQASASVTVLKPTNLKTNALTAYKS